MKIAVCVKQVPDAAATKRIDPGTKRLDRSGEGALNAVDANAVEEALRLRDADGAATEARSCSSRSGRRRRWTRCARRSRWAPTAPCSSPTRLLPAPTSSRRATSLAKALEREGADLVLFGQQASDSDGAVLWAAVAERLRLPLISQAAELTRRRRRSDREAPDRVRLRRDPGAAARRRRGRGLDQRAALPVAEGDHGREEEAAGRRSRSPTSGSRPSAPGEAGSRTEVLALSRPAAARRHPEDRGRRHAAPRRSSSSSPRSGSI